MAYADTDRASRPSPISLGASIAINAAIVTAVIFAAPDVVPDLLSTPITGYEVAAKPIPPETRDKPPEKAAPIANAKPYVTPADQSKGAKPDTGFILGGTGTVIPGGGTGIIEQPEVKPQIALPVLTKARPDPRFAASQQPAYPPGMIREGREGVVSVRVLIGVDGRVKQVVIVSAATPEFADATEKQALRKWRFIPGTRDGAPVESWREMSVRFEMPE